MLNAALKKPFIADHGEKTRSEYDGPIFDVFATSHW